MMMINGSVLWSEERSNTTPWGSDEREATRVAECSGPALCKTTLTPSDATEDHPESELHHV